MLLRYVVAAAACLTAMADPAAARAIDCPLRNERYSADSPLMDILLKPEAMALLEQAAPGIGQRLPPNFLSTEPPSFSAILSLRTAAGMGIIPADRLASVDASLRQLEVTDRDREARCARYDVEQPAFDPAHGQPRILLFEKINGFRDGPSVDAARAAFVAMAARRGWSIVTTDRGGAITPSVLRQVDVVIWNNISGDVLTLRQRRALRT